MRVLHINQNFLGHALHRELVVALRNQGVDVNVFCAESKKCMGASADDWLRIAPILGMWQRLSFFLKQRMIVQQIVSSYDIKAFDFIHAHTMFADGAVALALNRQYGIPYVVAVRQTDLNLHLRYRWYLRDLAEQIMLNAQRVYFLSSHYRVRTLEHYVKSSNRNKVFKHSDLVPNGLSAHWVDNPFSGREDDGVLRVACVATMDKNKNILTLAKAMKTLADRGMRVSLELASNDENEELLHQLKCFPFFSYTGTLDHDGVRCLFRRVDVFALVSHRETFGTVYTEAMSQGLPVVYTRGEGFDGWFQNGEVGYCADSHSVNEIASAILAAYRNRKVIRERCLLGVKQFDWRRIAQRYIMDYQSCQRKDPK